MAGIAVPWVVAGTSVTSTTTIYTVATGTTGTYSQLNYNNNLVITNGGPSTLFVGLGTGVTGGATVTSFGIPSGGTLLLTNCQVPNSTVVGAISAGTSATYIGFGSAVSLV